MSINISKEAKASIVFIFASVCSQGMAVISLPVFTRLLSTEQMGVVTTYNTWLNLISMVTTLGLTSGSFNIAMMRFEGNRAQYTSSALALSFVPSIPLFVLSFPLGDLFSELLGISVSLVRCLCAMLVLNPAINLWLMRQRYEYRYVSVFVVTVLNSVAGTLFAVVAVVAASTAGIIALPEVRLISASLVTAVISVAIAISVFSAGRTFFNARYWGFALKTGVPLIVHSVAKYILDASDRILIGVFVGTAAVGIYGVLYSLSSVSLVFWSAINSALIPFIFGNLKSGNSLRVRSVASPLLVAYAGLCVALMLLAPEVVGVLAGGEYREAVYLVPPIASGIFFTSLYNLYSNLLLYKERTSLVMCATVCAAILNVALNIWLLPVFGYIAAAYATLASCCTLALMQYIFATRLGVSHAFDNRLNLILSVLVILSGAVVNLSYAASALVRYIVFFGIVAVAIINRRRLVDAFKSARS